MLRRRITQMYSYGITQFFCFSTYGPYWSEIQHGRVRRVADEDAEGRAK